VRHIIHPFRKPMPPGEERDRDRILLFSQRLVNILDGLHALEMTPAWEKAISTKYPEE
jgi:hypothetical protein